MMICDVDNAFNTLHEIQEILHENPAEIPESLHKIHETHKTHATHRSTTKPQYSPCSSHHIDMADCTRKINQELTLLDNPIVTKNTTSKTKNPTEDITSAARRLDISMIGAALFNHLVQKSQRNPLEVQIFSVSL